MFKKLSPLCAIVTACVLLGGGPVGWLGAHAQTKSTEKITPPQALAPPSLDKKEKIILNHTPVKKINNQNSQNSQNPSKISPVTINLLPSNTEINTDENRTSSNNPYEVCLKVKPSIKVVADEFRGNGALNGVINQDNSSLIIERHLSAKDLTHDAVDFWEPYIDKASSLSLGATRVEYSIDYSFDTQLMEFEDPSVSCARPGVKMRVGFRKMVVSIASEIEPGSCLYQVVKDHESEHVALYKKELSLAARKIEQGFMSRLKNKMILTSNEEDSLIEANLFLESFVASEAQDLLWAIRDKHALIDTKEEYERIAKSCQGEAQRVARRVLQN